MAPTVTLSLTTLAEVLFASIFVAGVIFISKKESKVSASKAGEGKGKKKKNKGAVVKDVGIKDVKVVAEKVVETVVEKGKKAKKEKKVPTAVAPAPVVVPTPIADIPSFAAVVAPTPAAPTKPAQVNKKTAVEARRKLAPVTAVDDMRDLELDPEVKVARVIKVVEPDTKAQEAEEAKWQAWKEEEEDDGEWEVQKVKSEYRPLFLSVSSYVSRTNILTCSDPDRANDWLDQQTSILLLFCSHDTLHPRSLHDDPISQERQKDLSSCRRQGRGREGARGSAQDSSSRFGTS